VGELPEVKGFINCPPGFYPHRRPSFSVSPPVSRHPDRPHAAQNDSCVFGYDQTWINKVSCP
jgi:hypothetical protein